MLSQNTALWLRQKWIHSGLPKAFVSSAGILNLPITSLPVDNFHDRALWCKSTGINYNMHGWILCRYCATGWFWWISGLRAVTMWSSSSFTKTDQITSDQTLLTRVCMLSPQTNAAVQSSDVVSNVELTRRGCNLRACFCNLWGLVTHICISNLSHRVSSHYRNKRWLTLSEPLGTLQWNLNPNTKKSNGNTFQNVVCKMPKILFRLQLTPLSRDKLAAVSQTIFSNAFLWMKKIIFCFKFHWSLFPGVPCH